MKSDLPNNSEGSSHGQILRSSVLIGGSQALVLLVGVARTKILAVLLGPAGFGLMSVYMAIGDLAAGIASLGVDRSGVREIAVAVGSGEEERIASTSKVVKQLSLVLGVAGALLLVVVSPFVAQATFGEDSFAIGVAIIALMVLCKVITGGQMALVQGLRRIRDLAIIGIVGALVGGLLSVTVVFYYGEDSVAFAVVGIAVGALIVSLWFSRPARIGLSAPANNDFRRHAGNLIKLGFAFMASAILMLGASYVVRILVIRFEGLQAAGFYQAAWALGGLYVGTILQAMGADFYPRLSASISDSKKVNRLVNEQTHVSLLLAGPGIAATIGGSSVLLALFYSAEFVEATSVLHWVCFGMALRVITWPIGYIIVAHGRQVIFFLTELVWAVVNVLLSWLSVIQFGLVGVGVAFFLSYVLHSFMIYPIVRNLTGFRWTRANIQLGILYLALTSLTLIVVQVLSPWQAFAFGAAIFVVTGLLSVKSLFALFEPESIPKPLRVFHRLFGSAA